MKRTNAEQIGALITKLLQADGIEGKFNEQQVAALWPQVVGNGVNRYTVERHVRDGVMYVTISSAALRNELMMNRSAIVKRLNEFMGREVIHDIVFR